MTIKTRVRLGRKISADELAQVVEYLTAAMAAGDTDGHKVIENKDDEAALTNVRIWATKEAADNWIAFVNTHTPPPLLATVVEE
jgi:hypothetical protein